jgi:transposase-like protein
LALLRWSSAPFAARCRDEAADRGPAQLTRSAFTGYRFPAEVILLAVCWYLWFALSYRDLAEILAERGIHVDQVTVCRWVQHFALLIDAARP